MRTATFAKLTKEVVVGNVRNDQGAEMTELVEDIHQEESLREGERLELEYWRLVAGKVETLDSGLLGMEEMEHLEPGLLVPMEVGPDVDCLESRVVDGLHD